MIARLLRALDAEPLAGDARILSLGAEAAGLAEALRARGHEVLEIGLEEGEAELSRIARASPGSFDCVLALGFVERLRWDRWALQQIHRVLKGGGTLVLTVPDLFSLPSLADPRYIAAKFAKLLAMVARAAGRRAGSGTTRRELRTYAARRLRGMLERLGYEARRWSGIALPRPGAPAGDRGLLPTHHLVVARKHTAPAGSQPEVPDPTVARRRFESENRAFVTLRDGWRREHAIPSGEPRSLDPETLAGARILVLSPHPDDEIIGCGGTLLRLVRAGARVTVLQATDGSASAALEGAPASIRQGIRLEEARAVADAAGFEPTIFWREDNAAFRHRDDLVLRLRESLRQIGPAMVFTPFLADIHPDHLTLNRILAGALEDMPDTGPSIVGYEVWSLTPANLWCDVTSCMGDLERLLLLYETAMKVDDFIHMCSARSRYHSLTFAGRPGHAEAFFASAPQRFRELIHSMPGGEGATSTG